MSFTLSIFDEPIPQRPPARMPSGGAPTKHILEIEAMGRHLDGHPGTWFWVAESNTVGRLKSYAQGLERAGYDTAVRQRSKGWNPPVRLYARSLGE